jgi:hypothetical protein
LLKTPVKTSRPEHSLSIVLVCVRSRVPRVNCGAPAT